MIAGAWYAAVTWGDALPAVHGGHSPWRYALLFGALPAIPLMILRPFLPESPRGARRRPRARCARPRFRELFEPRLRRVTLLTTLLVGLLLRAGLRHAAAHSSASSRDCRRWTILPPKQQEQWVSWVHVHVDIGALIGRLLLAGLVVWFVARRPMLRWVLVIGLGAVSLRVPRAGAARRRRSFKYAVLLVTMVVGVQYSFWGNYLPRVFPLHLRGTGESFAMSFGARMLAPFTALAHRACSPT